MKKTETIKETKASSNSSTPNGTWIDRGTPMLTTYDNPFNPFTQFSEWLLFDQLHQHNCCAYLDRMAITSPSFTDRENNYEIEKAIDALLDADFLHVYRKVFFDDFD